MISLYSPVITLFAFVTIFFILGSPCKDGYENFMNISRYCFKRLPRKLTWYSARKTCEDDVGDLITYNNARDYESFVSNEFTTFWLGYRLNHDGIIRRKSSIVLNIIKGLFRLILFSYHSIKFYQ